MEQVLCERTPRGLCPICSLPPWVGVPVTNISTSSPSTIPAFSRIQTSVVLGAAVCPCCPHPLASGDALALSIHSFIGLGTMCFDTPGPNCGQNFYLRWHSIRGTRWAWFLQRLTGEVNFCDIRTGLDIGKWSAGGWVTDALIKSRSPNHCILAIGRPIGQMRLVDTYLWPIIYLIPRHPIELASRLW